MLGIGFTINQISERLDIDCEVIIYK
jgi:hypothetical protein